MDGLAGGRLRRLRPEAEQKLLREARERFRRSQEHDHQWRKLFLEDLKFRHGDSDNGWQWPDDMRSLRAGENKPCLTLNITRQHNLQISNDLRKNKSTVTFIGMGNGATQESANLLRDLWRHVEWKSSAQQAYTLARNFQIDGGMGFWRLGTRYEHDDSMDQEICVWPVLDPLMVYLDPDAQNLLTYEDGRYAFLYDVLPKDQFDAEYPRFAGEVGNSPLGEGSFGNFGLDSDSVMVCEYFRKVKRSDRLLSFVHRGERQTLRASRMPEGMEEQLMSLSSTRSRELELTEVEHYTLAGSKVIDQALWAGSYIPLIPVMGEVTKIEGQIDRKGHTRAMKDPQRMYNVNASSQVEYVALQTKTPWIIAAEAIEEHETLWQNSNRVSTNYLVWNHKDDQGQELPVPQRVQPPTPSQAYETGLQTAFTQLMMTSGQWQNQMGMAGNERTGEAIKRRQSQSDNAVFHFQDNYEEALRYTGRQFLELFPKIYDTKRLLRIQAQDGTEYDAAIDPAARQAFLQEVDKNNTIARRVLNPQLGRYGVAESVGPAYGSKREETREALSLILTQAPALTGIIGDLLVSSMDFEDAQEAAKRLKRMAPPQALGQGPSPAEQQLQQQVAALTAALQKSLERQGKDQLKLVGKDQMREIDVYEAETKRMAALQKLLPMDQEGAKQVIDRLVKDSLGVHLGPIMQENASDTSEQQGQGAQASLAGDGGQGTEPPPMPGARKAPDGQWYLTDPSRQGKYLKVAPLAQQRAPVGAK